LDAIYEEIVQKSALSESKTQDFQELRSSFAEKYDRIIRTKLELNSNSAALPHKGEPRILVTPYSEGITV
jgi:hypothetical protein